MDSEDLKQLRKQHIDSYRNAIIENIKNNTNVLVDDDIMSLIKKPPLDSMDYIKTKFLDLAKKNKIVLNTEDLSEIISKYRDGLIKSCEKIKKIRVDGLIKVVDGFDLKNNKDVIKINKKNFVSINKEIKQYFKYNMLDLNKIFNSKLINTIFKDDIDTDIKNKFIEDILKYMKGSYQKQLLENIDIKILVKDTTLINITKEHSDRFLFTMNNSRLFNDSNE